MSDIIIKDLGVTFYDDAWNLQHSLFNDMINKKRRGDTLEKEWVLITEHQPVVTLGKHAKASNLLLSDEELERRGVLCRRVERGGDVTFHGPGQVVMYPIIDLEQHRLGVKKYVDMLEEAVIRVISEYGIKGERVEGASGVWIEPETERARKICALGVKCSRFCTMHGLALNVCTDLSWFRMINPCGFVDKGVTSMELELGIKPDMAELKQKLADEFIRLLHTHAQGRVSLP